MCIYLSLLCRISLIAIWRVVTAFVLSNWAYECVKGNRARGNSITIKYHRIDRNVSYVNNSASIKRKKEMNRSTEDMLSASAQRCSQLIR